MTQALLFGRGALVESRSGLKWWTDWEASTLSLLVVSSTVLIFLGVVWGGVQLNHIAVQRGLMIAHGVPRVQHGAGHGIKPPAPAWRSSLERSWEI